MNFKNYELRLLLPDNDLSYEIVCWNKRHETCFTVCFLRINKKEHCYEVENVGVRPFEACEKTKGFAGWLQKIVDILNYINNELYNYIKI